MKSIKYLRNSEINFKKWDFCIKNSVNVKVYAFSWYLDIVASNWDCIVYDDYKMVMPVVFKRQLGFFKKNYHPIFCQQLGPFSFSKELLRDENIIESIFQTLIAQFSNYKISINHVVYCNLIQSNYLQKNKVSFVERINLELDLSMKYDQLYKNFSSNTKRNLRPIPNSSIKRIVDVKYFISLYKKYLNDVINLNSSQYQIMYKLIISCMHKNIGVLQGLFDNKNNLLGAIFVIHAFKRHILLFNFSNTKYYRLSPMTHLINDYILTHASKSEVLDFEGSSLLGVKRFYKGFGATEKNYIYINQ